MNGLAAPGRDRAGHLGLVYQTVVVRHDAVASFVEEGLRLGEQVLLAARYPGWESALTQHGVDTRRSAAGGSLTILDAPHFFPAEGQAALVDPLLASGRPGVRLVTSAEEALAYLGESGFRRVEQEMDDLCETRPVMLLCHVRSATAAGEPMSPALDTFVDTHGDALQTSWLSVHRTADGLRLYGEVDRSNSGLLEAVLARAGDENATADDPTDDGALDVDLSQLGFLDVAGYRALVRGTELWRGRGGTVLLSGARGPVRRVLELMTLEAGSDVRLG